MTFLNPLLLFGLMAAAIPILVHLFNFRRPRRVVFSSLQFLRALEKSTMQRMRVQQWLLLALRILALAALALAFARPVLEGGGPALGRANASVVLVVDNSPSMQFRNAQGAYFDQAKTLATTLVEGLEDGDEVFLLPTAADPARRPAAYRTRAALLDALAALAVENGTVPLTRHLDRAAALLADATFPAREIYVVSDFQQSTLADSARAPVPFEGRVVLLPVGGGPQSNVAVTDVQTQSRIVEQGQPVTLAATLVNSGARALPDYAVTVYLAGRPVARNTATLAPGAATTVPFTFSPDAQGWLDGEVRGEADGFEDDNARAFVLHVPETRRILVVRGEGADTRYVETALAAARAAGAGFDVTAISEDALAARDLSAFDAVVLASPAGLASGEVETLARFVTGGGGVLAAPGLRPDALNALLASVGGGTLAAPIGDGSSAVGTLGALDREHPVFAGVFDGRGGRAEALSFFRYAPYRAGSGAETTLLRLTDGQPALQEIRQGAGAILLFTGALDARWSDLPTRGLFLPLLYRSLFYLAAPDDAPAAALVAGQRAEIRVGGRLPAAPPLLVAPSGQEYVMRAQPLFGGTLLETDEAVGERGVYTLTSEGAVLRRVAVGLDPRESDPALADAPAAREKITAVTGLQPVVVEGAGEVARRAVAALAGTPGGREIWNILLWVALLLLGAEMIVSKLRRPAISPV